MGGYPLDFENPNRTTFVAVLNVKGLWPEGLKEFYIQLNQLSNLRNHVAHRLKGFTGENIVEVLGSREKLDKLIESGDRYLKVEGHFIFDLLINKIKKILQ